MRTIILILIQVALFSALAFWYQQNPGSITINWLGYTVETGMAVFIGVSLLVIVVMTAFVRVIASILNIPSLFRSKLSAYHMRQGIREIEDGITALYTEDAKSLSKVGKRLKSYIKTTQITNLLLGQGAFLEEDYKTAHKHFQSLTKSESLAYLGFYGLAKVAFETKELSKSIEYLDQALIYEPNALPARYMLVNMALMDDQFLRALHDVNHLLKRDPDNHFLVQQKVDALGGLADQCRDEQKTNKAVAYLKEAYSLDPHDFDVQLHYIETLSEAGKIKDMKKLIQKIWTTDPNEHFVSFYLDTTKTDNEMEAYTALHTLLSHNPQHYVSLILQTEQAIRARLWGPAHEAINKLIEQNHPQNEITILIQKLQTAENRK